MGCELGVMGQNLSSNDNQSQIKNDREHIPHNP